MEVKKSDKPDSITSDDIKSMSPSISILSAATNKTIPDIISSANIEKESNKESIDSVPSNKDSIDSGLTVPNVAQRSNKESIDSMSSTNKIGSEIMPSQIVKDSNAPNIGPETMSSLIIQDSNAHRQESGDESNPFDGSSDDESAFFCSSEDEKK